MRKITTALSAVAASIAIAAACGYNGRAEAGAPKDAGGPLFREAAAASPASAEASVPVGSSLAPLIERLKPAVVNISTTTVTKNPHRFGVRPPRGGRGGGGGEGGDEGMNEFFERFFGRPAPPEMPPELKGQSLGSGFILNGEGYILTNNHVVENATDIRVRLADQREFTAKIVGRDPLTDVALIKLGSTPANLPTVVLGDSDALRQGDFVVALGSPFGLSETATLGIVSAKHRNQINAQGTYDDFIQTDAAINPGNSGGPLFNLRGEVVGINTAIVSPQIGQGIGFAVPINLAKAFIPQLQAKGKVTRGFVGVSVGELTPDLSQAFGLQAGTKGALVQNVLPKTPAAKAGIEPGDVVVALNGKAVETAGELTRNIALVPPGNQATLTVLRKGQKKELTVTVATRPDEQKIARGGQGAEEEEAPADAGKSPKLGVNLGALTPDVAQRLGIQGDQGVVVMDVVEGGPADRAGIRRGDVILEVRGQAVTKPDQVAQIVGKMKDGDMALLRVKRGDAAVFIAVPVGGRQ